MNSISENTAILILLVIFCFQILIYILTNKLYYLSLKTKIFLKTILENIYTCSLNKIKLKFNNVKAPALLITWSFLHLFFLVISDGNSKVFWPLDATPRLIKQYDFTEFLVYSILPWIYYLLKKNKETN